MLLFSTILPIKKKMKKNDFVHLVIEWNQQSRREDNVIQGMKWKGEQSIRYGDDKLWLEIEEYRGGNIIAIRYEKQDQDGSVWDTDYVMNFNERKLAIRLDRSYTQDALSASPAFSTPNLISLLIGRGYVEDDQDLPVLCTPIKVDEESIGFVAELINKERKYGLPVVYVSRTYSNETPVDTEQLAERLKGIAHVLVQESNETNGKLREMCDDQNEFNGAIGIYFPNHGQGHRRYLYRRAGGHDSVLMEKVIRSVMLYFNSLRIDTLYTWQGVNNTLLQNRLSVQREERAAAERAQNRVEQEIQNILDGMDEKERSFKKQALEDAKAEANKLLDSFEDEIQKMTAQIAELSKTNEALQQETQGLRAKLDAIDSVPILCMGEEEDLYQGEIKDLILTILSDALETTEEGSRRRDIIEDIIASNGYQKTSLEKAGEVKKLLKDYTGMTGKLRQSFMDIGFEVVDDRKHYKLTYYGDNRYQTILGKTPSDVRSGKNNAREIIKMVF